MKILFFKKEILKNKKEAAEEKTKGLFNKVSKKIRKKIALGLLSLTLLTSINATANDWFKNYVIPAKGYETKFTAINDDVLDSNYQYVIRFRAYDDKGNVLDEVGEYLNFVNKKEYSLTDLFPSIDPNNISLVEVLGTNKNRVWITYSKKDGDNVQKAMVLAPEFLRTKVYDIHFTNNDYWNFLLNIANLEPGAVVKAKILPNNELIFFDGTTNAYGFLMPDLSVIRGASINIKDQIFGSVPEDAGWMEITSEKESNDPFSKPESLASLVGNTLFMKRNRESGGAFSNQDAFEELIIPHIDDDTKNPDPNKRYWWTGLVLVNPNSEDVKVRIEYYKANGFHLDVNPEKEGRNDYELTIPAGGKIVDLISNLGMPENAAYARVIATAPIIGGELFGGEPSGKNWPIMAGVSLLLPGNKGIFYSVEDMRPVPQAYIIPVAKSKENTEWTGLALLNNHLVDDEVIIYYNNDKGETLGEQKIRINAMNKYVKTLEDMLKEANLSDIREEVSYLKIKSKYVNTNNTLDNLGILAYALYGGLEVKNNELIHTFMIGEDAVTTSPIDLHVVLGNKTVGLDSMSDIINSNHLIVEDNDEILAHVIATLKNTKLGEITGYDIIAFDDDWNRVGTIAAYVRLRDGPDYNKFRVNNTTPQDIVDSDTCPYGTYNVGIKVYTRINGVEKWWYYRLPGVKITRNPEQDYDVDSLKGEGWSYLKSKSNFDEFCKLISLDDVVYMDGNHYSYETLYGPFQKLFDGKEEAGNFEADHIEIIDTHGGFENSNAGAIKIWRTDGHPEWFSTSSEATVEKWKKFYEVGSYNNSNK
ncbi:hypothetical protein TTHT_0584 [Thermotomaculum hydrothermale]|uniref:Uncharacterized protein n=1 Tax=Thermotomaculum hydrothermale TaxID=981385 RepID=A0A7R6PMA1_9BACT|nr:hypothetical protein [Thermotomaculum hydrothermale]BBB32168.1 hypothetical protein TTHT_0584 [Thermotomaculum hydrothermale]